MKNGMDNESAGNFVKTLEKSAKGIAMLKQVYGEDGARRTHDLERRKLFPKGRGKAERHNRSGR
jgi:hypothetical protein